MSRVIRFSLFTLASILVPTILVTATRHPVPVPTRVIALTFDDGPTPVATEALQSVLRQHNVPATFFIVGKMALRYGSQVASLVEDGHEIANHSWSHPNLQSISPRQFRWELWKTNQLIERITGKKSRLFRTPGSTMNYLKKRFQVPSGYQLVLWDVHSLDHKGISSNEIVDRIVSQAEDGDIVLLHNGLASTTDALNCIIPQLRSYQFEFVTVSELLRRKGSHPSIISG